MPAKKSTQLFASAPQSPACERAHLLIGRHIDGELLPGDSSELRAHLNECPRCRHTLDVQAAQSTELAASLDTLWRTGDDEGDKKKGPGAPRAPHAAPGAEPWWSARRLLVKIAAVTTLLAIAVLLARGSLTGSRAKPPVLSKPAGTK